MDTKKLLEILDKNINQEQLAKDLVIGYLMPLLEEKVASIDIIKGTDLDKELIMKAVAALKEMVK